jgi:hypothetical protein
MSAFDGYYYDEQIRKYIVQFMAVFADMKVNVGKRDDKEPALITVPIAYGHKDRTVAWIKGEQTQNKPLRLPAYSAYLTSIDLAPELRKGVGGVRRNAYMPSGGEFPTDISVVRQQMPVPYKATFELSIYTSNTKHMQELLEQILLLFDPILQIQTSDELFDWTKITTLELTGINNEQNNPIGTDRRIIQQTLTFTCPIYMSAPATVKKEFVERIIMRLAAVPTATELSGGKVSSVIDGLSSDEVCIIEFPPEETVCPDAPVTPEPDNC